MFWGSLGLTYDAAVVPEPPTTYDVVFEPEWKGKLAVVEDPVGLYTHVGHILGFNIVELTEDQLQQVNDYLRRMLGQSKGVSASYGDATTRLVSGDAVFAFPGWYAVNQFARDAGKDTVQSTLPEEGGYSFCDSYAIPPTADNVDSAHAWINQGLDPVANAEAANYLVGGTTCEASVEFLSDEVKELYSYDNLDEIVAKAPFYPNPPIESDEFVTMEQVLGSWQELKATA
jgi:spermidine/putrescine-binding protein